MLLGAFELITDESKAGSCLWITNRRGMEYWPTPTEEAKYLLPSSSSRKRSSSTFFQKIDVPQSCEKVCVILYAFALFWFEIIWIATHLEIPLYTIRFNFMKDEFRYGCFENWYTVDWSATSCIVSSLMSMIWVDINE